RFWGDLKRTGVTLSFEEKLGNSPLARNAAVSANTCARVAPVCMTGGRSYSWVASCAKALPVPSNIRAVPASTACNGLLLRTFIDLSLDDVWQSELSLSRHQSVDAPFCVRCSHRTRQLQVKRIRARSPGLSSLRNPSGDAGLCRDAPQSRR